MGRVSLEKIKDYDGNVIVDINQEITEELAGSIQAAGIERVKIRSVLTCESKRGVCVMCYGRNLASGRLVELGEATGVIAAQSIGEPGTQLTMRTFHIGGTASRVSEQSRLDAKNNGTVRFIGLQTVKSKSGDLVVMNRQGSIAVVDDKNRERERYSVIYGAKLKVNEGDRVAARQGHGRVGSLHLRHPYRNRRRGAVQGLAGRRDAARRSRRSHRLVAARGGRFARREAPARDRGQGQRPASAT